jgi:hypothetical protein
VVAFEIGFVVLAKSGIGLAAQCAYAFIATSSIIFEHCNEVVSTRMAMGDPGANICYNFV